MSTNVTVFYSWQSDLPPETNSTVIRNSLRSSASHIELQDPDIKIKLDEATRSEAGSPDIPNTIFDKIKNSDIFVCDLTTINNSDERSRKCPNPNVMIELGYAAAYLGWQRIIMVFNKHFGDFTKEVPFDLEKKRISTYTVKDKNDKSGRSNLEQTMIAALQTIISQNPQKPTMLLSKDPVAIKRHHDITKISKAIGQIHLPTFDYFMEHLPNRLVDGIFHFWYQYEYVIKASDFYLYDKVAHNYFITIFNLWNKLLSYPDYTSSNNGRDFVFYIPADVFVSDQSQKNFKNATKERVELKEQLDKLLNYLKENYLEIDIDQLSNDAWQRYLEYQKANPLDRS